VTVAVLRLTLRLPENGSLKGKRQVLKSVEQRLHNRFNVSVAEVDANDAWQIAVIAICCVANSARHANEVVSKASDYLRALRLDLEIVDEELETISV
jgi:uncharacterized protein YlxP (DUF503 family)